MLFCVYLSLFYYHKGITQKMEEVGAKAVVIFEKCNHQLGVILMQNSTPTHEALFLPFLISFLFFLYCQSLTSKFFSAHRHHSLLLFQFVVFWWPFKDLNKNHLAGRDIHPPGGLSHGRVNKQPQYFIHTSVKGSATLWIF